MHADGPLRSFVIALLACAALGGCGKEGPGTTPAPTPSPSRISTPRPVEALPEAYFGRWFHTGASGGIDGRGRAGGPGEDLEIHGDGRIDFLDAEGRTALTRTYAARREKTIFSTTPEWVVEIEGQEPLVLRLGEDGSLAISENVYDGILEHYAREAPAGR